ncbi:MAG: hypothetical protein Q9186_001438 [Xanthomendoza sp. 1 TL-2023]
MGNLCSTPKTTCCKRPCPFGRPLRRHARGCKRIKYTLVPQRDPDGQTQGPITTTTTTTTTTNPAPATVISNHSNNTQINKNNVNNLNNVNKNNGSPNNLHRSNAIRRPGHSRSRSSSTSHPPNPPSSLQIRNITPPTRPTSIVPTLMLIGTPSTGPTTSVSHRSTTAPPLTAPTSPTTVVSGSFNYSSPSSGSAPRTLYIVDGEVVGSDEEGLELRWIDALRAPGAPGGYRTVVDVVEERRSGRLTVVNGGGGGGGGGGGRGSEESVRLRGRRCSSVQTTAGGGGGGERDSVNGIFAPRVRMGRESYRAVLEGRGGVRRLRPVTPVKRKPVPVRNRTAAAAAAAARDPRSSDGLVVGDGSPLGLKDGNEGNAGTRLDDDGLDTGDNHAAFRWRKAPMSRPPIPVFQTRVSGVTEKELLDEVEDVRRILDGKEEREGRGQMGVGGGGDEGEMMDWFWVDDEGVVRYWRGGLPR